MERLYNWQFFKEIIEDLNIEQAINYEVKNDVSVNNYAEIPSKLINKAF